MQSRYGLRVYAYFIRSRTLRIIPFSIIYRMKITICSFFGRY